MCERSGCSMDKIHRNTCCVRDHITECNGDVKAGANPCEEGEVI